MSIHQCPKCELRFTWKTELDDHCAHDHPTFHHDYPIRRGRAENDHIVVPDDEPARRP
jgi:hypothetical protein